MKKKLLKLMTTLLIIYLFVSAIYVLLHIDFGTPPEIAGMGFGESRNTLRIVMGLPKTLNTYQGVSPIYLIQVIVKVCMGIIFSVFLYKKK